MHLMVQLVAKACGVAGIQGPARMEVWRAPAVLVAFSLRRSIRHLQSAPLFPGQLPTAWKLICATKQLHRKPCGFRLHNKKEALFRAMRAEVLLLELPVKRCYISPTDPAFLVIHSEPAEASAEKRAHRQADGERVRLLHTGAGPADTMPWQMKDFGEPGDAAVAAAAAAATRQPPAAAAAAPRSPCLAR